MKIYNNFNYQINWAVLNEGTDIWSVHTEPVLPDVRRLYYGQDEVMKRYVGSDLAHLVEWQRMTRMETIPFSTSRYNDSSRFVDEEVVTQQGVNGWTEYVWTTEVVNGVRTGNRTSELVGQFQAPRQQQIAVGTKLRNMLKPGSTGRYAWGHGGDILYYFEWIQRPEPDKMYSITRYGPTTGSDGAILAVEPNMRAGNSSVGVVNDGQTKIVKGSAFAYRFGGGDVTTSLGLSVGLSRSPQSPRLQLIVYEV